MRSTVSFLIGCVLGATGVLMYLHENRGTLRAAEPAGPIAASVAGPEAGATAVRTPAPQSPRAAFGARVSSPARTAAGALMMPVVGFAVEALRPDFDDPRSGGRKHEAIDIRAPRGTPVVAVADGTIRKLFTSKAGGLTIYHFDAAEETCYYYAHLDRYADGLSEGMRVRRGDVIGFVGTTGNAPPGTPHLHFAVHRLTPTKEWWKGTAIDPYPLLTAGARLAAPAQASR